MGVFDEVLKEGESLFKNEIALDFSFQPKLVPYRESHQKQIASCIRPLFDERNGKNIILHGKPGLGKTVATKHVLWELEDYDDVETIYINCWQKNSSYKVILEMCEHIGYRLTHNKKTDELFKIVRDVLNKKGVVFVFDEIDKLEDTDVLYMVMEEMYRKSIITITNYKSWYDNLDTRLKSRMIAETLEFKPYTLEEIKGILEQRMKYAFVDGVWQDDAFEVIVNKAYELQDVRTGLYLMKESTTIAEDKARKKVTLEESKEAVSKLNQYTVHEDSCLSEDEKRILDLVKKEDSKIGDLFTQYQEHGGKSAYKTFQRRIKKLEQSKFIDVKKTEGGKEGNTTLVGLREVTKKLTEF
ncbi:Cdc6/Cdc18 family protein [Nanoarchaeota archaeon]